MEQYKKDTVALFEAGAKNYEARLQEMVRSHVHADLDRFVSTLKGSKVLDVGCGPGVFLEEFRERGVDALGIDLSDVFIQRCHQKGLNVRKMDMEQPLLYPHSFDGIWSSAVMQHLPRERVPALLNTWLRLLKRDGILFLAVQKGTHEGYIPDPLIPEKKMWLTYFVEEEIRRLVEKKYDVVHFYENSIGDQSYLVFLLRVMSDSGTVKFGQK